MRATTRLAWRLAGLAAFGATAALAVVLSSRTPVPARLVAVGRPGAARCAGSSLRIWVAGQTRGRFDLEFTNHSDTACELSGYPDVAGSGGHPGVAGRLASEATAVVLEPGATAHAPAEFAVTKCHLQVVDGLRVGLPGYPADRYIGYTTLACDGADYSAILRVGAIQPGSDGAR